MKEELLAGKIVTTHGVRGEVKVFCYTDSPDFFDEIENITIEGLKGEYVIEGSRAHKGASLLKLSGIDNMESAQLLVGKNVFVKREDVSLPEGRYYIVDIIGCSVFSEEGEKIGVVKDVFATGSNDVFSVEKKDGKMAYIPHIDDIVKDIDIGEKKITVHIIGGLIDDED